jgi:hypothetical protein
MAWAIGWPALAGVRSATCVGCGACYEGRGEIAIGVAQGLSKLAWDSGGFDVTLVLEEDTAKAHWGNDWFMRLLE